MLFKTCVSKESKSIKVKHKKDHSTFIPSDEEAACQGLGKKNVDPTEKVLEHGFCCCLKINQRRVWKTEKTYLSMFRARNM